MRFSTECRLSSWRPRVIGSPKLHSHDFITPEPSEPVLHKAGSRQVVLVGQGVWMIQTWANSPRAPEEIQRFLLVLTLRGTVFLLLYGRRHSGVTVAFLPSARASAGLCWASGQAGTWRRHAPGRTVGAVSCYNNLPYVSGAAHRLPTLCALPAMLSCLSEMETQIKHEDVKAKHLSIELLRLSLDA